MGDLSSDSNPHIDSDLFIARQELENFHVWCMLGADDIVEGEDGPLMTQQLKLNETRAEIYYAKTYL